MFKIENMLEAPNFKVIREHGHIYPDAICCIVFAPRFHRLGYESIIQRFGYLDSRSSEDIHFYCAGYGAYWNSYYSPDMELINVQKQQGDYATPWAFSQHLFAKFVDEIEEETKWRYTGGAELIILNPKIDFSNCMIFNLDKMIKDEVINHPGELFELLIQYAREYKKIGKISRKEIGKIFTDETINGVLNMLPKSFENIWNIWQKGKHYTLVDIS